MESGLVRVEAWNSAFLSSCKGVSRTPAELSGVAGKVGLILEVQQGRQTSLHVVRELGVPFLLLPGNQALSRVEGQLGVLWTCVRDLGFLSHISRVETGPSFLR